MPSTRNTAVPAVYLIIRRGEEVLLMRRQGSGYFDGWYSLPAGHVEAGELPVQAAIREAREELGIELSSASISLAHTMYRTKHDATGDRFDLFFSAQEWSGEIENREPHKCDHVLFVPLESLPPKIIPYIQGALQKIRSGVGYSELTAEEASAGV
jgi:ADP-ribose pyrophosphatase YjhB (NUDIX family)